MKASSFIPSLALTLSLAVAPAVVFAAELAQSSPEARQEAAAREQLDTLNAQLAAAKAQSEAAARAQADIARTQAAAKVQAESAVEKARLEMQKAQLNQAKVRSEEAKARAEADRASFNGFSVVRIPAEPVTFLGVMTAPAPSSLTTQLGRPAGLGLVVVSVQAKSPAEDVLKVDDLLLRIDDQKLINNDQLNALIRAHQEGEEVTLTYVRGGKEATAKVKLAKQEAGPNKPMVMAVTKFAGPPNEEMKYGPSEWKIGSSVQGKTTAENGGLSQTFTYSNGGAGVTEIKTVNGKKTVTLRNSSGSIEFSGPYDTEEERKAVPPSVQTRVADAEARINEVLQIKAPTKAMATATAGKSTLEARPMKEGRGDAPIPEQPVKVSR